MPVATFEFSNEVPSIWDDVTEQANEQFYIKISRRLRRHFKKEDPPSAMAGIEAHMVVKHRGLPAYSCRWVLFENDTEIQQGTTDIDGMNTGIKIALPYILKEYRLEIPHPRMTEREFVLRPLLDIDPNLSFAALGVSVQDALDRIEGEKRVAKLDVSIRREGIV